MESELTVAKVIIKTDNISLCPSIDQIMDFLDANEVEYPTFIAQDGERRSGCQRPRTKILAFSH